MIRPVFSKKEFLEQNLRINHAGEYGAKRIYTGQINHIKSKDDKVQIDHMREQELVHLNYFEKSLPLRGVRPSFLLPIWHLGGYLMGAITAKMGTKQAMICTEAVEEVIDEHYENQRDYLKSHKEEQDLYDSITKFQADEVEHKEIAEKYTKNMSKSDKFLYNIINKICKAAIFITGKI